MIFILINFINASQVIHIMMKMKLFMIFLSIYTLKYILLMEILMIMLVKLFLMVVLMIYSNYLVILSIVIIMFMNQKTSNII